MKHNRILMVMLVGLFTLSACGTQAKTTPTDLSKAEIDGLLQMVEEEKLAGDVYQTLFENTGLQNFANIVQSERRHQSAVQGLLQTYGISDPTANQKLGAFSNPEFSKLYQQLTAQGAKSNADALKVGALIEELDIADLNTLAAQTKRADVLGVYDNLTRGSRNHLRSFDYTLKTQTNQTYQPTHLSQAEYNAIINSPQEKGNGGGMAGCHQGQGKGKGACTQSNQVDFD